MSSSDMMEVYDQNGNRVQVTRQQYITEVMNAARQNWDNLQLLRQIGPQTLQSGFVAESLELTTRAAELSGGHVPDLYWRSAAQAENGLHEEAIAGFSDLKEDAAYPADQARAAMGLARVRAKQNNEAEALSELRWAADVDPENPAYLVMMFGYFNERQRGEEGLQVLRDEANKRADRAASWRALMQVSASQGKIDEVVDFGNKALAKAQERERQDILAELSYYYGQAQKPEEIIALLEPIRNDVKHPLAFLNLAQAYADTGRKDEAEQLLNMLASAAPDEMKPVVQEKLAQIKATA